MFKGSREQHLAEVEQLEGLVTAAQQLVGKQTKKYTQQLEKLSLADRVILELLEENDSLISTLTELQVLFGGLQSWSSLIQRVEESYGLSMLTSLLIFSYHTVHIQSHLACCSIFSALCSFNNCTIGCPHVQKLCIFGIKRVWLVQFRIFLFWLLKIFLYIFLLLTY